MAYGDMCTAVRSRERLVCGDGEAGGRLGGAPSKACVCCYAMSGTAIAYAAARYGVPGTGVGCALSCYTTPTRCPVLRAEYAATRQ
eukprot:2874201-Rhodomonas_salina.2